MKILLATDGSDAAKTAGDFLTRINFPPGTEVRLLNVIRDTFLKREDWEEWEEQSVEHVNELEEAEQLIRKEREELLSEEAERLERAGLKCSTEVSIGQPAEEIIHASASLGANLIVLGSIGASGLREFHLGRVTNAVLEYAPFSLLIVKPPLSETESAGGRDSIPLRLLIAADGSHASGNAIRFCQKLALPAHSEVHVLSILRLLHGFRQDVQQRLSNVWHKKKTAAKAALDKIAKDEKWSTPHVTSELRESSSVTEEILEVAKTQHSDLIVLGNTGKGSIESFLIGSVTRRISRHAPCSVLSVRA